MWRASGGPELYVCTVNRTVAARGRCAHSAEGGSASRRLQVWGAVVGGEGRASLAGAGVLLRTGLRSLSERCWASYQSLIRVSGYSRIHRARCWYSAAPGPGAACGTCRRRRPASGRASVVCRRWLAVLLVTVTRSVLVPAVAAPCRTSRYGSHARRPRGTPFRELAPRPTPGPIERGCFWAAELEFHALLRVNGEVVAERVAPVA